MNPVTIGRKGPTENNVDIEQNGSPLPNTVDSVTMQIFLNNQKGATENQTFTYIPQENDSDQTFDNEEIVDGKDSRSLLRNGGSSGIRQSGNNQNTIHTTPDEQEENNVELPRGEVLNDPLIQPAIVADQNEVQANQGPVDNRPNNVPPIVPDNGQPVAIPADNINLQQQPAQNQGGPVDNRPNNLQPMVPGDGQAPGIVRADNINLQQQPAQTQRDLVNNGQNNLQLDDPLQRAANEVHRPRNPGIVDINGRQFRIRLIRGGQDINPAPEQLADLVLRTQRLCNDLLQVNNTIFNGASRINFNLAGKEITYINRQANNQNHSIKFNQDYISHTVDGQITPYNLHQDQVDRLVTRFDGLHHSILQLQPRRPDEEEDDDQDRVNNNAQLDNNNQMLDDLDDLIEEDLNVEEDD